MSWEYYRENIPTEVQDQILRTHFKFRELKSKFRIGEADVVQREALMREYLVLSELTSFGEISGAITYPGGFWGPLKLVVKKALLRIMKPVLRQIFQRQATLNEHLISRYQSMHDLELRVQSLERDIKRLSQLEHRR